jgi:SAM-dependent methyltransferase
MIADPAHESTDHDARKTSGPGYADRLRSLQGKWWKRLLPVQAPYRWNIRRLHLGRTLDVGCGIGRNLAFLDDAVGVDHNATSIGLARSRGLEAYTADEFVATRHAASSTFDSLLFAHVLEHMPAPAGYSLVEGYLPYLKEGGRLCFITPQERGYASDPTHVEYIDLDALRELAGRLEFVVERAYSFPFPRWAGRLFIYNEFVLVARRR